MPSFVRITAALELILLRRGDGGIHPIRYWFEPKIGPTVLRRSTDTARLDWRDGRPAIASAWRGDCSGVSRVLIDYCPLLWRQAWYQCRSAVPDINVSRESSPVGPGVP
jgi:hypothetical protein